MIIRDAQNKDIPQLLELLSEVLEIHAKIKPDYFVSGYTKYSEAELEAILKAEDVKVYVADEDGRVLGYAFCMLQETLHKPFVVSFKYMYIDDLCVDSACRGKGIGNRQSIHQGKDGSGYTGVETEAYESKSYKPEVSSGG